MRQLTCTAPHEIEWRDVTEPRLESDTDALVRPLVVARCDIDLFLTSGCRERQYKLSRTAVQAVQDQTSDSENSVNPSERKAS